MTSVNVNKRAKTVVPSQTTKTAEKEVTKEDTSGPTDDMEVVEEDTAGSVDDMVVTSAMWGENKHGENEFQFYVKFLDKSAPDGYVAAKAVFSDDEEVVKRFIRKNKKHAVDCVAFSDDPEFTELDIKHNQETVTLAHRRKFEMLGQDLEVSICQFYYFCLSAILDRS